MNLGEIETEVREMFGFPAPAAGGTDPLVQATIWRYINDAFTNMVNAVDGLPSYIEFEVDTSWALSVTVGAATLSSIALDGGDHYAIKIAGIRAWGDIINLTDGSAQPRGFRRVVYNERGWKADQASTQGYFDEFDITNDGLILLPKIDQTNTIGQHFKKRATPMTLTGSTPDSEIEDEYHNKYPVMYACSMLALQKEDTRFQAFRELGGYKDKNTKEYTGMIGDFVYDFMLADLGAELHSIADSHF